jgi:hypothetical protein
VDKSIAKAVEKLKAMRQLFLASDKSFYVELVDEILELLVP